MTEVLDGMSNVSVLPRRAPRRKALPRHARREPAYHRCSRGGLFRRPPLVGKTFPFDALPDAMRHLQSGKSTGKVVVEVD